MDQQLERKFLVHVLKDAQASSIAKQRGISEYAFQWSTAGKLYALNSWFVESYGTILSATELTGMLKQSSKIPEDLQQSITVLFNELSLETPDTEINFIIDQFLQYEKQTLIERALRKSVETLSERKPDLAIEELKNSLNRIEGKFRTEIARSGQLDEFAPRILEAFEDRKVHPEKYEGIKIGYSEIDRAVGGLVPGSVTLVMGSPKDFKSALLMNMVYHIAKRGIYVYLHINEGTIELFYMRFAAMELCIPLSHIKDNLMSPMEESRWLAFINSVKEGKHQILNNIYFDEVPLTLSTPAYIENRIKKLQEEGKKIGLVGIDHFGRMSSNDKGDMQDWMRRGIITQEICSLALATRIPFILLTHVKASSSKDALEDNKDFDAYSLERSGSPLKDVDYVFSWRIENREDFDRNGKKGFARLSLVLSRHSETCTATLQIDGKYMQIQEIQIGGTSTPTI